MDKILNVLGSFFGKNYKTLLFLLFGLFLLYWVIFIVTPSVTMSNKEKAQIDSLNVVIQGLHKENLKLDSTIFSLNNEIKLVDKQIEDIKHKKTKLKQKYHEEINRVDNYTEPELDSFFSDRYKK
jgi:vacuolar-type H+-ATPase subunit I/STV1